MNNQSENIVSFMTEQGDEILFHVLEETRLNGVSYLLVTKSDQDDEAYIMKDVSKEEDSVAVYDMVVDDKELSIIASIFEELLEDVDFISVDEETK